MFRSRPARRRPRPDRTDPIGPSTALDPVAVLLNSPVLSRADVRTDPRR